MLDRISLREKKLAASVVIVVTLFLQFAASARLFSHERGPIPSLSRLRVLWANSLWPFVSYPMYSTSFGEGTEIERQFVVGALEDSTEVRIASKDLGVSFWLFRQEFVAALKRGDIATIRRFAETYEEKRGEALVGIRLESHPLILTRDGLVEGKPEVVAVFGRNDLRPEE